MTQRRTLIKMNSARHMVITPKFRVSFPNLFTAKPFMENGIPKGDPFFSIDMIFDSKEDFKKEYKGKRAETPSMLQVVGNAKRDQWGTDKDKWPEMPNVVFKPGNERVSAKDGQVLDGYKDKYFVTAKSNEKFQPKVLGKDGRPITEADLYGGCFARAQLIARPYATGKNFGVRFILLQVIKIEDGPRFGGVESDVFDVVEEEPEFDSVSEDDSDDSEDF